MQRISTKGEQEEAIKQLPHFALHVAVSEVKAAPKLDQLDLDLEPMRLGYLTCARLVAERVPT